MVIEGGKALRRAIVQLFGATALVQRMSYTLGDASGRADMVAFLRSPK
jgi:hypothetical protein